jgi:flagellar biogenesis protein FliO
MSVPDVLWVLVSLLGVLGLMFLTFFGLGMLNRRVSTSGGRLRVVDRASLGRDSMLLVVSVCGKLILIGVSSSRVEKLADLDISEEEYVESAFAGGNRPAMPFSDILSSIGIKNRNADKQNQNKESKEIGEDTEGS